MNDYKSAVADGDGKWTLDSLLKILQWNVGAAKTIRPTSATSAVAQALMAGSDAHLCRVSIFIGDWITTVGPKIINRLVDSWPTSCPADSSRFKMAYKQSNDRRLAMLLRHLELVWDWCQAEEMRKDQVVDTRAAGRQGGKKSHRKRVWDECMEMDFEAPKREYAQWGAAWGAEVDENIAVLPANLYGVLTKEEAAGGKITMRLDSLLEIGIAKITDRRKALRALMTHVIQVHILFPAFGALEGFSVRSRDTSAGHDMAIGVALRAYILKAARRAFGSDGIFYFPSMSRVLSDPCSFVHAQFLARPQRIKMLLNGTLNVDLFQTPADDLMAMVADMECVTSIQLSIIGGSERAVMTAERGATAKGINDPEIVLEPKKKSYKVQVTKHIHAEDLVPGGIESLRWLKLQLVLEEGLRYLRGSEPLDERHRRFLKGEHMLWGTKWRVPSEQLEPIRHYNESANLLRKHYGGSILTGRDGLSEVLVYGGTGQGGVTARALGDMKPPFGCLETTISRFSMMDRLHDEPGSVVENPYENMNVYGQPNHWLALHPVVDDKPLTLEEKFSPYWASAVGDGWENLLKEFGMLGVDPLSVSEDKKVPFGRFMALMENLALVGMRSGITLLQMGNNLHLMGVLQAATVKDMVRWLMFEEHGATSGLRALGFDVGSVEARIAAFVVTYDYLERVLDEDTRQRIVFSTNFLEHFLCKTHRWERISTEQSYNVLSEEHLARFKDKLPTWVNLTEAELKASMERAEVCDSNTL